MLAIPAGMKINLFPSLLQPFSLKLILVFSKANTRRPLKHFSWEKTASASSKAREWKFGSTMCKYDQLTLKILSDFPKGKLCIVNCSQRQKRNDCLLEHQVATLMISNALIFWSEFGLYIT